MTSLADRLRGIIASGAPVQRDTPAPRPEDWTVAEALEGSWSDGARHLVIDRTYGSGHRHGRLALMDYALPPHERWRHVLVPGDDGASAPCETGRALFIDLETTGLGGGAGTIPFLIGVGWFEGGSFRVRQLLLTDPTAERAVLAAVRLLVESSALVVSYNGKSFDLPLMETRFLFHRLETPFAGMPHLDMLHLARRLWRSEEETSSAHPPHVSDDRTHENDRLAGDSGENTFRLNDLERIVCGYERDGDVPGFEIPSRYFHFVRTGDSRPLVPVLEHNRLDILALAFLSGRAAQLADSGVVAARTAREALALGALYERVRRNADARACYARAAGFDADGARLAGGEGTRLEALRAFARLARRERRHTDAARAWKCLLDARHTSTRAMSEAAEALAIHHEHRLRDPQTARALALSALPLQATRARVRAVEHRLARLDRKLEERAWMARLF
jgi:uncharacterized protein YprB with RNaseH-like and TPR domain